MISLTYCKDTSISKHQYHCNSFASFTHYIEIKCYLVMFGHKNKHTHIRTMAEFKIVHTHLCFQPQPRSISPTQKQTILSMLDAGQSAHSIASTTDLNVSTISRLDIATVLHLIISLEDDS